MMARRVLSPYHRWSLNGHADDVIRGQHGTLVNTPTWADTSRYGKQCIVLDGNNQYVNLGDVAILNAVEKFTLCFWMNQDVIDVGDIIFRKQLDNDNEVQLYAGGGFFFMVCSGAHTHGSFDLSTVISAGNWSHVATVFDGSLTGDAERLKVYVDAVPMTLNFVGPIPATTADLSGVDATIGAAASSFDGRLSDFRIYGGMALTRDEWDFLIHRGSMI